MGAQLAAGQEHAFSMPAASVLRSNFELSAATMQWT